MKVTLLENEVIFRKTYPHFLSMLSLYLTWFYIGCVGAIFIIQKAYILQFLKTFPLLPIADTICLFILWTSSLMIPAIILAFYRVKLSWFFFGLFLVLTGGLLKFHSEKIIPWLVEHIEKTQYLSFIRDYCKSIFGNNLLLESQFFAEEIANCWLLLISLCGIIGANLYRKSHKYFITNFRIITRFSGLFSTKERDLIYSKIDDMIIYQGILGRLFNFGTIIPISASGIGTGSDQVFMLTGMEQKLPIGPTIKVSLGGGKSVTVPRAPSFYALYGVPEPDELKYFMLLEMGKREYGYKERSQETVEE